MNNFFVSINQEQFSNIVRSELESQGIQEFQEDQWYPTQLALDLFQHIEDKTGNQNLVALGMAYVETALFPPEVNSIDTGLQLLADTYGMNLSNTVDGEGYTTRVIDPHHIRVKDNNPFPHDVVYGFIWGMCRKFARDGERFKVYREYNVPSDPDSAGAVYNIHIEV